jgi:hypothetical protein
VMNDRHALMGLPNDGVSSFSAKGLFNETVFMIPK